MGIAPARIGNRRRPPILQDLKYKSRSQSCLAQSHGNFLVGCGGTVDPGLSPIGGADRACFPVCSLWPQTSATAALSDSPTAAALHHFGVNTTRPRLRAV